jgi:protease I
MKGRTCLVDCLARHIRCPRLPLILAMIAAVCWGAQQPQGVRRRTPRAASQKTIQLPEAATGGTITFERALLDQQRLSVPSDQRLRYSHIGQLAWAAQGVQVPHSATSAAMPASAPLPAMQVYFVLPEGVYVYNPNSNALELTAGQDQRQQMAAAVGNQVGLPTGGAQIVLAGSSREYAARYGVRAKNVMLLQAGQAAQNIQLQAVGLGLTFISLENANMTAIRRVIRLPKNLEPLYVIFLGYPSGQTQAAAAEPEPSTRPRPRKVLLVASQQGFQDQELLDTKRGLELAGVTTAVASTRLGSIVGMLGGTATVDVLINQAKADDYGAVVFIGGAGAVENFANPAALNLARQAVAQRRVLAAIGTAPSILANAGVLRGVRATGFLPEQARIQQGGATYTGNPVEKDGLVITATGAMTVQLFVQAILEGLGEAG